MSHESIVRIAAVVAAIALLAAPYRDRLAGVVAAASQAAYASRAVVGRLAAAGLLIAAAWGKVPLPTLPQRVPVVTVTTPSDELQRLVAPVREAMARLPAADRSLWAATWTKAGVVVAGEATTTQQAFTDAKSLRAFTSLAVDIAWRRIGNHAPGSVRGLRDAVEAAYGSMMGTDDVPVTADVRARYIDFANAVAWAGVGG